MGIDIEFKENYLDIIELLESKKQELEKYIERNEEAQDYAHANWEVLSDQNAQMENEEDIKSKKRKIKLFVGAGIFFVIGFITTSGYSLPLMLGSFTTCYLGWIANTFYTSYRRQVKYQEVKDAWTIFDNLKYDAEEAKRLINTIDFLLGIYKDAIEKNDAIVEEYYQNIYNIYQNMLDVKINYAAESDLKNTEGCFKIINSRRKTAAQDRILRAPSLVRL